MKNNTLLQARLRKAGLRLRLIGSAGALVWGLVAAVVLLVFAAWLDLLWELSPTARIALVWAAGVAAAMLLVILAYRTARTASPAALARRMDIAANSSGEILTGWELDSSVRSTGTDAQRRSGMTHQQKPKDGGTSLRSATPYLLHHEEHGYPPLTAGLVTMAAEHAESLARRARWPKPFRPNRWAGRWRSWPHWRLSSDCWPWPCPPWSGSSGSVSHDRWPTCRPAAPCSSP